MNAVIALLMILSPAFSRELSVGRTGDADNPVALLIHGSPGDQNTWAKVISSDIKNSFYLLSPDRHGYGGSGKGLSELSLSVQAEDFAKLIEKDALVVGYSYGGAVAVKMALMYPEKVRGLILLAPALNPQLERLKWWQSPAYIRFIRDRLPSDARVSMEESIALPNELKKLDLSLIKVPVHYVQGREDRTVSLKTADYVEKNFTGTTVKFHWLDQIDHHIPEKAPEIITQLIGEM